MEVIKLMTSKSRRERLWRYHLSALLKEPYKNRALLQKNIKLRLPRQGHVEVISSLVLYSISGISFFLWCLISKQLCLDTHALMTSTSRSRRGRLWRYDLSALIKEPYTNRALLQKNRVSLVFHVEVTWKGSRL